MNGIAAKTKRRFKATTNSRHCFPVAENLLKQRFTADGPNKVWTSDITYVWTEEGWLYLAIVLDVFSRQIVGWAMRDRIDTALVLRAFNQAVMRRRPASGLIFHSDRGIRKRLLQEGPEALWCRPEYEQKGRLLR